MRIGENPVATEDVAFSESLRGSLSEAGEHGWSRCGIDIPWLRHLVVRIERPGRALQAVAFGQVLSGPGAKSGPSALFPGGILWQLRRSIEEFLALIIIGAIEKELIHEVANCDPEPFFS